MQMQAVLRLLVDAYLNGPDRGIYGLQICEALGLGPGTVYPILARLQQQFRWVDKDEEEVDSRQVGRAKRFFYRLNEDGAVAARLALAEVSARRPARGVGDVMRPAWEQ